MRISDWSSDVCSSDLVRLMNIGTEEMKGTEEIRDAAAILRAATSLPLSFDGFTEGDKIGRGDVDVIVSDGFSGNVALKTAEGTARFVTDLLRTAFTSSIRSKLGFLKIGRASCRERVCQYV